MNEKHSGSMKTAGAQLLAVYRNIQLNNARNRSSGKMPC